jgi:hypothetical protein
VAGVWSECGWSVAGVFGLSQKALSTFWVLVAICEIRVILAIRGRVAQ